MSTNQNTSTPYVVQAVPTVHEAGASTVTSNSSQEPARPPPGRVGAAAPPMAYPNGTSSFRVYTDPTNLQQTTPFPNVAFDTYPPSPISAGICPQATTQTHPVAAAETPGGDWTVVAGKAPARTKTAAHVKIAPRPQGAADGTRAPLDKGKARGPPGPPSPPRPTKPLPPPTTAPNVQADWRTMPRDFYHMGTGAHEDGDVFNSPVQPPVDRARARPSADEGGRTTNLGQRNVKRARRHSPIREEDSFVPVSKDLDRMNAYEADFPMWSATPQGGQTVRVSLTYVQPQS